MRLPQHAIKISVIFCLVGTIGGVWIGRYVAEQARSHAEAMVVKYLQDVTTGICKSEGYDGGALIDMTDPAGSRCFTAEEQRQLDAEQGGTD